jgi:hypothetical protein
MEGCVMAETAKEKAGRLQKRREKQKAERERTGDTPEATAEGHSKRVMEPYDPNRLRQLGERTGLFG